MALYEGIALIQEKQAVVLDLGTEYTKFGFTGEPAPRCIVNSQFWCTRRRCYRRVHDYTTPEELYDNLVNMLHLLYFRYVLVNPKERKVVVVESLLTPTLFRETLAKVLFIHYEVSAVTWYDTGRASVLTLGVPEALVIHIGATETEICPVLHGCVVISALRTVPLGARAVREELARILDEDNGTKLNLSNEVLEDIKVKTCVVIDRDRSEMWRLAEEGGDKVQPARSLTYPVRDGSVLVTGRARELAAEVLWYSDNELGSLAHAVLRCVRASPRDARRALLANVLAAGGGAALPGLAARLRQELLHLLAVEPYRSQLHIGSIKFHRAPAPANCAAWCGAAAAEPAGGGAEGGAGGAPARALPREAYLRQRRVPDWPNLRDNAPPHRYDHLY